MVQEICINSWEWALHRIALSPPQVQYWYSFSAWKTALVQLWVLWIIYANFLYFISNSSSTVCVPDIEIDAIHTEGNLVKTTAFRKSMRATIRWHWNILYTKLMTNFGQILLWLFPKENFLQICMGSDTSVKVLMSGYESNYVTSFFFYLELCPLQFGLGHSYRMILSYSDWSTS